MIDDGVKGEGIEDDQVKVADIAMHLLEALEAGDEVAEARHQSEFITAVTTGPAEGTPADLRPAATATVERVQRAATKTPTAPSRVPAAEPADLPEPRPDAPPDNLVLIQGLDPVIAGQLNKRGITTFDEIAALDDAGLVELEAELEIPGRIRKWRWIEQARSLVAERDVD